LIVAAVGLFDVAAIRQMWRVNRAECVISVLTTLGVIWLDLLHGILLAVVTALLLLIKRASRPPDAVLGRVPGMKGWHAQVHHDDAATHPGLLVYRFGASIVFFNAAYFKKRVMDLVGAHPEVEWFILDGSTINLVDITGAEMLEALIPALAAKGIRFGLANARHEVRTILERAGVLKQIGQDFMFQTLNSASDAFFAQTQRAVPDSRIRAALEAYFRVLQNNPTAEEMRRTVVTTDFETGFADGHKWRGADGLRDFLAARAGFADEQHDIDEVLAREDLPSGDVRIKTRLKFSLRQPPGNELFTGTAFHTWLLHRDEKGQWRVAAQIVDAFADLNDNAKRLFAKPDEGLNR
jgi:anti-anti-sigma regulatory factor